MTVLYGQGNSSQNQHRAIEDDEQLPITNSETPEPTDPVARANRRNRSNRYNRGPRVAGPPRTLGPELRDTVGNYHWPAGFPSLPVSESDVVVVGEVSDAQAYLSGDGRSVYSEFSIRVDEVIKNDSQNTLVAGSLITAHREGGRVRFPSGHVSRFYISGLGMPRAGRRYVFFLTCDEQDYRILTGYELRANRVIPLDNSGVVNFNEHRNADEESFLNSVHGGIAARF